ncbi:reverse transcriptase-like protein [Candidatus Roizmanbacteria bacterium]|nr:reverse transcriptase-like protein [Candidatus Roizmanbacteria bacterium]
MGFCKNCGTKLIQKETKKTAEQLKKPYYYSAYYFCPSCKKLYHDEKFKVVNNQTSLPSSGFWTSQNDVILGSDSDSRISFDVEIWTDGACINNGTPRAKAAWGFVSGEIEQAGLVEGKQTNNVAEGLAIYHALAWAAEQGYKKIKLHTDSQISLFNLNKHHSLVKVNQEIFKNIAEVIDKNKLKISFIKVLGHSGDINNDRVDKLANDLARSG